METAAPITRGEVYEAMLECNKDFRLYPHMQAIVRNICGYYSSPVTGELDPKRGILLFGPNGCGKSRLMQAFQKKFPVRYSIRTAMSLADDFANKGFEAILPYRDNFKPIALCIDDIGYEEEGQHFGSCKKATEYLIMSRYDHHIPYNLTHGTTNLTRDQLHTMFGTRAFGRMCEMFNFVMFPPDSPDLRTQHVIQ